MKANKRIFMNLLLDVLGEVLYNFIAQKKVGTTIFRPLRKVVFFIRKKEIIMENLFIFVITFTVVFLVMLWMYFKNKKSGALKKSKEILILQHRFKVDKKKLNSERLGLIFTLIYSLIIALTGTIASDLEFSYVWRLLIALALMMSLIYISYAFTAIYLNRNTKRKVK